MSETNPVTESLRYLPIPAEYSDDEYLRAVFVNAADAMVVEPPEGFTVHTEDPLGETALHAAAIWGDIRAVRLLVEAGAALDKPGEMDCTPLYYAVMFGFQDIVEYLLAVGAAPDVRSEFGDTAIELASGKGMNVSGLSG